MCAFVYKETGSTQLAVIWGREEQKGSLVVGGILLALLLENCLSLMWCTFKAASSYLSWLKNGSFSFALV